MIGVLGWINAAKLRRIDAFDGASGAKKAADSLLLRMIRELHLTIFYLMVYWDLAVLFSLHYLLEVQPLLVVQRGARQAKLGI